MLIRLGAEVCARLSIRSPTDADIEGIASFIEQAEQQGRSVTGFIARQKGGSNGQEKNA